MKEQLRMLIVKKLNEKMRREWLVGKEKKRAYNHGEGYEQEDW
jgi:hypothetical protein